MSSTSSHRQPHSMHSSPGAYRQLHCDSRVYQQDGTSPAALTGHALGYDTSSSTTGTPSSTWTNSPSLGYMQYAGVDQAYLEEQLHWDDDDDSRQEFLDMAPSISHSNQTTISGAYESTGWSTISGSTTPYIHPDQSRLVDFDVSSVTGSKSRSPEAIEKRKEQNRKAQRAYRARREAQARRLDDDFNNLLHRCKQDRLEQERLLQSLAKLKHENETLKRLLRPR